MSDSVLWLFLVTIVAPAAAVFVGYWLFVGLLKLADFLLWGP